MSRARHSQQMCVRVVVKFPTTGEVLMWHSFQTARTYGDALTMARESLSHDPLLPYLLRELPAESVTYEVLQPICVTRKIIREALREDKKRAKFLAKLEESKS